MGEYDSSGAPVAETIWLSPSVAGGNQPFGGSDGVGGYAPLAVATGSGGSAALYWVHGNHLGVPIVTTDASGAAATPPAYTMAGFPGQTHTLSDLYYNRYRDYDSSLGRYIQSDPIGLRGGSNPYVYAGANPLRYVDPKGTELVSAIISAGINIGLQTAINYEANGGNLSQALKCVDPNSVLAAFAVGFFLPGAGATIGTTAKWAIGRAGGQEVEDAALSWAFGSAIKLPIVKGLDGLNGRASCECSKTNTGVVAAVRQMIY